MLLQPILNGQEYFVIFGLRYSIATRARECFLILFELLHATFSSLLEHAPLFDWVSLLFLKAPFLFVWAFCIYFIHPLHGVSKCHNLPSFCVHSFWAKFSVFSWALLLMDASLGLYSTSILLRYLSLHCIEWVFSLLHCW